MRQSSGRIKSTYTVEFLWVNWRRSNIAMTYTFLLMCACVYDCVHNERDSVSESKREGQRRDGARIRNNTMIEHGKFKRKSFRIWYTVTSLSTLGRRTRAKKKRVSIYHRHYVHTHNCCGNHQIKKWFSFIRTWNFPFNFLQSLKWR